MTAGNGVIVNLPGGQFRKQWVTAKVEEPVGSRANAAVVLVDQAVSTSRELLCVLRADDSLVMQDLQRTKNFLTDEEKVEVTEAKLPYQRPAGADAPKYLKISERGDQVYLAWADGNLLRFDCRDLSAPVLAEKVDVVPENGVSLTCLEFMNGRNTLIAGDSAGGVRGWFWTKPPNAPNPDGIVMRMAHELPRHRAAVTACTSSTRTRLFATSDAAGGIHVAQMTTEKLIAEATTPGGAPIRRLDMPP